MLKVSFCVHEDAASRSTIVRRFSERFVNTGAGLRTSRPIVAVPIGDRPGPTLSVMDTHLRPKMLARVFARFTLGDRVPSASRAPPACDAQITLDAQTNVSPMLVDRRSWLRGAETRSGMSGCWR
jgi:hypothetical protein